MSLTLLWCLEKIQVIIAIGENFDFSQLFKLDETFSRV